MSDIIRIVCIVILFGLAFFCLQVGVFLLSGHKFKNNSRRTLVLIQFITCILLAFDALAYIFRGNCSQVGFYMVRISNFMVFAMNYALTFFFCFYAVEFIKSDVLELKILLSPRKAIKSGIPLQLFIVFFICSIGLILTVISQFTNLFYYFDDANLYHRSALYPLSIVLGLLPGLITLVMLFQSKKFLQNNVFISLFIYSIFPIVGIVMALFVYGISWIDIGYGVGALHLFYSSIKLMELEFYSDKKEGERLSPNYKQASIIPEIKKRIVRTHFWQVICVVSGGILAMLIIVSITGIILPEKEIVIDQPYLENDYSKAVSVTFLRDAEKVWNDNGDLSRVGAQYNGVIYNNMKATIITDWKVTIDVVEDCAIDPGPWNGTFSISDKLMTVRKPKDNDEGNIHGSDFYQVTPLKTLGFGCIMYSPATYSTLDSTIVFTYESLLKPLSYITFDIIFVLLAILFIGKTKFVYDIWGDTVNVASRMESSGETSKIHVSEATWLLTKNNINYSEPIEMEIKGKGVMKTYFLS